MAAVKKPTSPGPRSGTSRAKGAKAPTVCSSYSRRTARKSTFCLARMTPSMTRTRMTTPRYVSYQLSSSSTLSGASGSPTGGGTFSTIISRIS